MISEIVYCFPTAGDQWLPLAWRFINTYHQFNPMAQHRTTIVLNGPDPGESIRGLFRTLPEVKFLNHDNSGYDIGAYQAASAQSTADLIAFFAASTYFRVPSWLNRMVLSLRGRGPGVYGAMGNRGDGRVNVWPHLRTTAFWTTPTLFNAYPHKVTQPHQRYPFEHGSNCYTEWIRRQGLKAMVVTTQGEYEWVDWDNCGGFHRGDQAALLVGDRLSEPPYWPHA